MHTCDIPVIACAVLILIIVIMLCKSIYNCCQYNVARPLGDLHDDTEADTTINPEDMPDTPSDTKPAFISDEIQNAFSACEKEYGVGNCIIKDGVILRI